jgi:hypothetical protein
METNCEFCGPRGCYCSNVLVSSEDVSMVFKEVSDRDNTRFGDASKLVHGNFPHFIQRDIIMRLPHRILEEVESFLTFR